MDEIQANPDHFKSLENIFTPDPRSGMWARHLNGNGNLAQAVSEHYAEVARLKLGTSVPETIQIQFETAKNLYLYSWFVYRFYPVAELHALTCLELGLRQRFPTPLPKNTGISLPAGNPHCDRYYILLSTLESSRMRGFVSGTIRSKDGHENDIRTSG